MFANRARHRILQLLAQADVQVDGGRLWDILVRRPALYSRVLRSGSLGLGEAYMDGWWECAQLDAFFYRVLRAGLDQQVHPWAHALRWLVDVLHNRQSRSRAFQIGQRHYDIGNDLYRLMLDRRMIYSCGYWQEATTLDEAQETKLDLVCRKLALAPGMRVLDIGCGWGGTARYMAERYQVAVVGITVSEEQVRLGREVCQGLPVEIRLQDYRSLDESFDRVVSIGMYEHVGRRNYRTFMRQVRRCLKDDGLFLLHTIGRNRSVSGNDPWIDRYIFPNSMLPSVRQIAAAAEGLFVLEDWHGLGAHYDRTLMAWFANFDARWPEVQAQYGQRFYRMWKYYLLSCAGSFRARVNQLWQVVFSPRGVPGGYRAPR